MEYIALMGRDGARTPIEFPDAPGCQTFADADEDRQAVAREALEGWLEANLSGEVARHVGSERTTRTSRLFPAGVLLTPI